MAAHSSQHSTSPDRSAGQWPIPAVVHNVFWRRLWSAVLLVVIMLAAAVAAGPAFGTDFFPFL